MKYARIVDGRTIDPVVIPDPLPFGITPEGFLSVMFPGYDGFVLVPDDVGANAVANPDGTFTNPTPVEPAGPEYEYPTNFEIIMAYLDVLNEKINGLADPA